MTTHTCDCCRKGTNTMKVRIPIMVTDGEKYIATRKMDMCQSCAREIMKAYYDTAHKNGFEGLYVFG